MSDETGIPEEGQAAPTQDWERDYKALQAEYTRSQQTLKSFESDPNALISFIQEKHPDLLAEEAEEEDTDFPEVDEDDPVAPIRSEIAEFKAWKQQIDNERGQVRFKSDLQAELGDEKVPAKVTDWIQNRTAALGNNPKALKQAVEEYREFAGEIRGPVRKSTPTPPQPGKAGEVDYNASKDPNARRTARRARIAAQVEAGMRQE